MYSYLCDLSVFFFFFSLSLTCFFKYMNSQTRLALFFQSKASAGMMFAQNNNRGWRRQTASERRNFLLDWDPACYSIITFYRTKAVLKKKNRRFSKNHEFGLTGNAQSLESYRRYLFRFNYCI